MSKKGLDSILCIAWKTVSRKLFRNIVLALAVALLVSLLVFALLFNRAVQDDIEAASKKLGADIVMVPAEAITKAEEFLLQPIKFISRPLRPGAALLSPARSLPLTRRPTSSLRPGSVHHRRRFMTARSTSAVMSTSILA